MSLPPIVTSSPHLAIASLTLSGIDTGILDYCNDATAIKQIQNIMYENINNESKFSFLDINNNEILDTFNTFILCLCIKWKIFDTNNNNNETFCALPALQYDGNAYYFKEILATVNNNSDKENKEYIYNFINKIKCEYIYNKLTIKEYISIINGYGMIGEINKMLNEYEYML